MSQSSSRHHVSSEEPRWSRGQHLLLRYVRAGKVRYAYPIRCVRDSGEALVALLAEVTRVIRSYAEDGTSFDDLPLMTRFATETVQKESSWIGPGILLYIPINSPYAVWHFYSSPGELDHWYINLEATHQRQSIGLDTQDYVIDALFYPDGSWHLKDEDDFAAACKAGRFDPGAQTRIMETLDLVLSAAKSGTYPFDGRWATFTPPSEWINLSLPANWSSL